MMEMKFWSRINELKPNIPDIHTSAATTEYCIGFFDCKCDAAQIILEAEYYIHELEQLIEILMRGKNE